MGGSRTSIATITVVVVLAAFALSQSDSHVGRASALFVREVLDLRLNGQDNVTGTIGSARFSPGDTVTGQLLLTETGVGSPLGFTPNPRVIDLDFNFRLSIERYNGPHAPPTSRNVTDYLTITTLRYGADDLLRDPGRNLTKEIDMNPRVANGDGVLSLAELEAGANDLHAPTPNVGTMFTLGVTLDPRTPNENQGDRVTLVLTFLLGDALEPDLNARERPPVADPP